MKMDIEIKMPRISKKQTNRCNIHVNNSVIYYRVSIFIPYIEKFINELIVSLEKRFTNNSTILLSFHSLFKEDGFDDDFINLTKQYGEDLLEIGNGDEIFKIEYKLWQRKLKSSTETENTEKNSNYCSYFYMQ